MSSSRLEEDDVRLPRAKKSAYRAHEKPLILLREKNSYCLLYKLQLVIAFPSDPKARTINVRASGIFHLLLPSARITQIRLKKRPHRQHTLAIKRDLWRAMGAHEDLNGPAWTGDRDIALFVHHPFSIQF